MKAAVLALCLVTMPLASCQTGLPPGPILSTTHPAATDKAYANALNAYNAAAASYLAVASQLSQDVKDQAKALSHAVLAALNAADEFRKAGKASLFSDQLVLVQHGTEQILDIVKGH